MYKKAYFTCLFSGRLISRNFRFLDRGCFRSALNNKRMQVLIAILALALGLIKKPGSKGISDRDLADASIVFSFLFLFK